VDLSPVEELIVEVVREAQRDGTLQHTMPAKNIGRLILAIVQGQEFLQKSGMPVSDLKEH